MKTLIPVVLEGTHVRLEPMHEDHMAGLLDVGLDAELWRWTVTQIHSRTDMAAYIAAALEHQRQGTDLPFVTIERATGRVVGSTRFGNIDRPNRRVEIGWTWVARPWQRTPINTEAKYLMLRHAFEQFDCNRVELKTDALNEQSRAAILRIGAVEEGILRSHMITENGRVRDTVYYSVLRSEWPHVRERLEARLARPISEQKVH